MLTVQKPDAWGKTWCLHRRRVGEDRYGDPTVYYDMDDPDYSAEAGSEGAVAWQVSDVSEALQEPGENLSGSATGRVFDPELEISEFDRVVFDGLVWEVRGIDRWLSFRTVRVVRVE